jgi:drug/metabolite transporter (DMT)-like permease
MNWQPLAFSVPLLFVLYQALSKTLPKGISIFLVNAYASLIGAGVMLLLHFATANKKSVSIPSKYLLTAAGIGLLVSLGNFGIIKAYSLGAPQSLFTILFYVTLIIYGVIFGLIFWNERLHLIQLFGALLAVVGLVIVVHYRK